MRARIVGERGSFHPKYYYLELDGCRLVMSDAHYSHVLRELTGEENPPHDHPVIFKMFKEWADAFNASTKPEAC